VDCTVACFESVDHSTVVEVEAEVEADYSTVVEVEVEVEAEVEADYSIVATYADSIAELVEKADNSEYCYTVAGCYYYDHECMVD
jgi:dTDP-glucose pyrophosphorylase